jgi:hypothetical protein
MLRVVVVGLKTLLLFMLLYTSPAFGQTKKNYAHNEVLLEYILILELEYKLRLKNKLPPSKPKATLQFHRIPKEKPVHPLFTYRDIYTYIVSPHNPNMKFGVDCYSVGIDKYGYTVKTPCKKELLFSTREE